MTITQREALTLNHPKVATRLFPRSAIALAISFGLCAGFLDVGIIVLSKYFWHSDGYFRIARDFPWTVPAGHVVLLLVPGVVVALVAALARDLAAGGFVALRLPRDLDGALEVTALPDLHAAASRGAGALSR